MKTTQHGDITVACIEVSPFAENTYIVSDASGDCVIIDPGCYTPGEEGWVAAYLRKAQLRPVACWLTHAHLDHVFGCKWLFETYGLLPELHEGELIMLENASKSAARYGVPMQEPPTPTTFIKENTTIKFGFSEFKTLFTPGHSPASLCFYNEKNGFVIAGDTLFQNSIGRTDLPFGNAETLFESIKTQLYTLPDTTMVYSGHGNPTTIGAEKRGNPYVRG